MRHNTILWVLALATVLSLSACNSLVRQGQIKRAIRTQLSDYPASTLKDVYKSFFQDQFGPGHLVPDTAQAGAYLRSELSESPSFCRHLYEPTGYQGNYYRVDLSVITSGTVPFDLFFQAFLESIPLVAAGLTDSSLDSWKTEWKGILKIIESMELSLPNFSTEKETIQAMLDSDQYVGHHSIAYSEAYRPHYRIIAKEPFKKYILPLLEPQN